MKRDWEIPELQEYWTLQPGELNLLTSRNDENRLGFALLLKFFQIEGRFPTSKSEIPRKCAAFVAEQIGVPAGTVRKYTLSSKALLDNSFEAQNCQKAELSIKDRDYRLVRGCFVVEIHAVWSNMVA
jgi:hypothetical protein